MTHKKIEATIKILSKKKKKKKNTRPDGFTGEFYLKFQ